uniref:HTH CENPB-type domain-containing protein n=1 Tax=Ditylenchus dipsaci TaxID=166011 RepID=A0A915DU64_9BILA
MSTPSKKRRVISLDVKQKIIASCKQGKTLSRLGSEFNPPKQSVQTILSNEGAFQKSIDEGSDAKRAPFKPVEHESLEEAVLQWVKDARSQNIPVTGPLMAVSTLKMIL